MKETKHIIFDLDGTIIDSKAEIIATYNKVLNDVPAKKTLDLNAIDFGANLNDVLLSIYGDDLQKISLAKLAFAKLYDNSNFENTLIYPHVYETLEVFKQQNLNLYIATNKRYTPTVQILLKKQLSGYFKDVVGNELQAGVSITKSQMLSYLMQKYHFNDGFMIGDTIGDMLAGKKNNLSTIAVTYGYQTEIELQAIKPNYIVNSFEKLLKFVI